MDGKGGPPLQRALMLLALQSNDTEFPSGEFKNIPSWCFGGMPPHTDIAKNVMFRGLSWDSSTLRSILLCYSWP